MALRYFKARNIGHTKRTEILAVQNVRGAILDKKYWVYKMLDMVSPKGSEATIMFDIYFGLDRGEESSIRFGS